MPNDGGTQRGIIDLKIDAHDLEVKPSSTNGQCPAKPEVLITLTCVNPQKNRGDDVPNPTEPRYLHWIGCR